MPFLIGSDPELVTIPNPGDALHPTFETKFSFGLFDPGATVFSISLDAPSTPILPIIAPPNWDSQYLLDYSARPTTTITFRGPPDYSYFDGGLTFDLFYAGDFVTAPNAIEWAPARFDYGFYHFFYVDGNTLLPVTPEATWTWSLLLLSSCSSFILRMAVKQPGSGKSPVP